MTRIANFPKVLKELYDTLPKFPNGRINYKNASKAAVLTCFVEYQDKILLLKRSNKVGTYKELWNTVSGYLDELKSLKEKTNEELHEELGISENEIKDITFGDVYEFTDEDIKKTWIIHPVLVKLAKKPTLKIDWEHTEYIWIHPYEITDYTTVPNLDKTLHKIIT